MAHDTEKLRELLERCEKASGPDRELDRALHMTTVGDMSIHLHMEECVFNAYTASLDASIALVERMLPGWWWKVGTCSVSDDACIAPDFNSPIHGDRLQAQFPSVVPGSELDAGFDVDRRPAGNPALALLESLLRALISQAEGEGA